MSVELILKMSRTFFLRIRPSQVVINIIPVPDVDSVGSGCDAEPEDPTVHL